MKKTRLLLVLALFCFALSGAMGQNSQWDSYNAISNYKSMKLYISDDNVRPSSQNYSIEMTINGDYTVDFYYSNQWENPGYNVTSYLTIVGKGRLLWQNEHMVIQMEVNTKASEEYYYFANGNNIMYWPPINKTDTYMFDVEYYEDSSGGTFVFKSGGVIAVKRSREVYYGVSGTTEAAGTVEDRIRFKGNYRVYDFTKKSQSEMNAQNSDMYGKWQWNDDRSLIYLESTTKDAIIVLFNDYDGLGWGFLLNQAARGYKTETLESGHVISYLMLSFDGCAEQSFSFNTAEVENFLGQMSNGMLFGYIVYDRFMGTLKSDASILSQIKDKRILLLNYKQNGSSKTAMFQLEGLEPIYNAITQ